MLRLDQITKRFSGPGGLVHAVEGVSLHVAAGEFVAVIGPSGCGKSTLLLIAGGLMAPDAGIVRVAGKDVYALSGENRARLRAQEIGFVFQRFHLVEYLTVLENVMSPSLASRGSDEEIRRRASDLIAHFGLADRAGHRPAQLSTGERQRVALARAMLNGPKLILADEPTGNLDADNAVVVLEALRRFAREGGAVLLVTHDPEAVAAADRVIRMKKGGVVEAPALSAR